jgi:hypothetical protein
MLRQYGFLLATAPLSDRARAALVRAMARLPGVHLCRGGRDLLDRPGVGVCLDDEYDSIRVLFDARTGVVLSVDQRVSQPSVIFPGLHAGALVQADTFAAWQR